MTIRTMPILCAAFALAACAAAAPEPASAQGGDAPNILVIGEDADTDAVPRNSRVFNRVLREIQGKMNERGFNVYDETAITLGALAQGRVRRDDAEIIEICRAVRTPPLDVAVIFSIWPDTRRSDIATYVSARVEGRMLQCRTGRFLGTFEQSFDRVVLPVDCPRNCVLESVGSEARVIGRDVAHALATELAWLVTGAGAPPAAPAAAPTAPSGGLPDQFVLVFDNFDANEVSLLEEYIMAFGGYSKHRLMDGSATRQEIWYETTSGTALLRRNLVKMLDLARIEAVVNVSGNAFTVEKLGLRRRVDPDDFR